VNRVDLPTDAVAQSAPVHPGDSIYLKSGNYGDIGLRNYKLPITNSDWVTVQAAPTQTPVFSTLCIRSTNKWVFKSIKVQSLLATNNNKQALVTVTDQSASLPTTDIILENMQISTADSMMAGSRRSGSLRRAVVSGSRARPAMARTANPPRLASR
jgi:hypothetical protein